LSPRYPALLSTHHENSDAAFIQQLEFPGGFAGTGNRLFYAWRWSSAWCQYVSV